MGTSRAENLLLIFTRNPELGKCKTRLASKVGDRAALDIYHFLLQHTHHITVGSKAHKQVYYSEEVWEDDIWESLYYDKRLQRGKDLGERMENAFRDGFKAGFKKIVVIGSDMYDLSPSDLEGAFRALDEHDYVVGPAADGGYYLLGMRALYGPLFKNKPWGTHTVLQETMQHLKNKNTKLLKTKNDVDLYEDIAHLKAFAPFLKHMKK